ncbi:hypothetical protein [Streptomyces sp. 5-10]|uniref:hypothetical protein n=1 Tax=Streptomyces sp. 5-10 TaxID=878925 RepID=UPI00168B5DCB|nr:hypothetical protein [Streptomyces sp. 5-10]MBD3004591.1 hypothetical protein [Streptomyces sp. 5-10]
MTVAEAIRMLTAVPPELQDMELILFGPRGEKSLIRTDISQLDIQGGRIQVYVAPQSS